MRFNGKKYKQIIDEKGITIDEICHKTGLLKGSIEWILDKGFASKESIERLAEVVEMKPGELVLPDISGTEENVIEFVKDCKRATVTFSQGRYKTRIKELAKKHPEECQIIAQNKDGSIYAHIPVDWIRINPGKKLTKEQRKALGERLNKKDE